MSVRTENESGACQSAPWVHGCQGSMYNQGFVAPPQARPSAAQAHSESQIGRSSNGRTRGSGPRYRGSNPCLPAKCSQLLTARRQIVGPFVFATGLQPRHSPVRRPSAPLQIDLHVSSPCGPREEKGLSNGRAWLQGFARPRAASPRANPAVRLDAIIGTIWRLGCYRTSGRISSRRIPVRVRDPQGCQAG